MAENRKKSKPHSRFTESGVELRLREKGRMTSGGRQLCADRSEAETAD